LTFQISNKLQITNDLTFSFTAGGVGIANLIKRIEKKENMDFGDLCSYRVRS